MSKRKILTAAAATLLASAGVALAVGTTNWKFYRSDLIRCEEAEDAGNPACGASVIGTDPLRDGRIFMTDSNIVVRLRGALPGETYDLFFVELNNTGADVAGPYTGAGTPLGSLTTNPSGNGNASFSTAPLNGSGPMLGYFIIGKNGTTNEFATGFDPFVPGLD